MAVHPFALTSPAVQDYGSDLDLSRRKLDLQAVDLMLPAARPIDRVRGIHVNYNNCDRRKNLPYISEITATGGGFSDDRWGQPKVPNRTAMV